jgi:two-component system, OmpR family, alkaline phosphatase synthesis response regulator PhoP
MEPITILVVEDEASIRTVARSYLESEGYRVIVCDNGRDALTLAAQQRPDLIVLDLMLPELDGLEVAAQLRQSDDPHLRQVYILMLTARSEEADRIAGLRLGADDYLTKPFSPREMVARVQAILRRSRQGLPSDNRLYFADLCIDPDSHEVWPVAAGGDERQLIDLTATEFKLLLELANNPGRALSREQLIDRVWGVDFYGTERVVDVYVGQVRRKLEEATGKTLIQTVRSVGYKFVADSR